MRTTLYLDEVYNICNNIVYAQHGAHGVPVGEIYAVQFQLQCSCYQQNNSRQVIKFV